MEIARDVWGHSLVGWHPCNPLWVGGSASQISTPQQEMVLLAALEEEQQHFQVVLLPVLEPVERPMQTFVTFLVDDDVFRALRKKKVCRGSC